MALWSAAEAGDSPLDVVRKADLFAFLPRRNNVARVTDSKGVSDVQRPAL